MLAKKNAEEDEKLARTRRIEARTKKEEAERAKREQAREQRRLEREERERRAQAKEERRERCELIKSLLLQFSGAHDDAEPVLLVNARFLAAPRPHLRLPLLVPHI